MRLPRGRHARPRHGSDARSTISVDEDVNERLRRLEALVDNKGSATGGQPPIELNENSVERAGRRLADQQRRGSRRQALGQPQNHEFWTNLVEETRSTELRDIMVESPEQFQDITAQALGSRTNSTDSGISMLGLYGMGTFFVGQQAPIDSLSSAFPKHISCQLARVYLENVDPVIKILHRPSLSRWMINGEQYLDYTPNHTSTDVLSSAVCYAAACSMSDAQAQTMFQRNRHDLVTEGRRSCEAAMERSGLLATKDYTVLQAFVLYLVAMRSEDRGGAAWTLVALAVRLAKSMCVNVDPNTQGAWTETFFEQQCRRRLWLSICLLDLQASFAQASEPLISYDEVVPILSGIRHINDADMEPTTLQSVPDREGLTDTTFALVTYHAQSSGRLLNFAAISADGGSGSHDQCVLERRPGQELRQQQSRQFENRALNLLHFCDPERSQYAWFTWHGTQSIVSSMRLSALRPLRRVFQSGYDVPVNPRQTGGDPEQFQLAMTVLEKASLMHTDPRGERFRWYVNIPWLAIAIAIAECYVSEDVQLVQKAWPVVESSYIHHETATAAHNGETLRGPLAKLMQRARDKLRPLLQQTQHTTHDQTSELESGQLTPHSSSTTVSSEVLMDPYLTSSLSPSTSSGPFGNMDLASMHLLPQQMSPLSLFPESQGGMACGFSTASMPSSLSSQMDPSWSVWDDFLLGISMDESQIPVDTAYGSY